MPWIPLHLHSQYSILDATGSVEQIAEKAASSGMPAVALTDHGNLFGAIEFYKACCAVGVKPIIGCEFYVAPLSRFEKKKASAAAHLQPRTAYHLILLAKDREGYRNLCRLSSKGYLDGFYYYPRIDKELLQKYHSGLICLSGCRASQVAHEALYGTQATLDAEINWYRSLFGEDYYLELQRHPTSEEKILALSESWLQQQYRELIQKEITLNERLVAAGRRLNIKVVATNDTHYLEPEDHKAHEILINIQSGEAVEIWEKDSSGNNQFRIPNPKRRIYETQELYFKTTEQMEALFGHDLPEALAATLEVADKCQLTLDLQTKHYPVYIPPSLVGKTYTSQERQEASQSFLRQLCEEGMKCRYPQEKLATVAKKYPGRDPLAVVRERLTWELDLILSKGMGDYLLIVWDFINWAKKQGIIVGPGRGSGVGSIILYLIGVTDIEPLSLNLFFERFINPERISYPDIDVDICMARRQEVINYTVETYGKENVAQIITFGTMKAKMTIKDIGRVRSVPLAKVNQISKYVPDDPNMTLEKALETDPDLNRLYIEDEEVKQLIDLGKKLEGSIRSTGIHATGLIICADPLTEHIPVCLAKDSDVMATQYSMKPVEMAGMLKIDFLGLKTLTSIQMACGEIKKRSGKEIDWGDLPLDDAATFKLLSQGKTLGVFQMESAGMQDLGRQLLPDKFEEIIAIGALYRPGPMDMIPSFINRKHGREVIEYDHPWLEPILEETYGIMVYQEQVMHIAQKLANYSLGEGDVLRRAMGKKDHSQMEKEREKFRTGAEANGISRELATQIFDKMEKFASYGFNKSHAAAYGYLIYVTAYLKANWPKEWMAALMSCDAGDITKVAKLIRECQAMGIAILAPDVNEAAEQFVATEKGIRFAMSAIKGVGEGVVEAIVEERKSRGPFKSFYEFFQRIDLSRVSKKAIEWLIDAGSFDFTSWSRDALRATIEELYETASKQQKERASGVLTFFGLIADPVEERFAHPPSVSESSRGELLKKEKTVLGFFLTGHPMEEYASLLEKLDCTAFSDIADLPHQAVIRAAFIIESVQTRISQKTQKKFAILQVSDGIESLELPIWPDLYEEKQALLEENQLLYAIVQIDKREEQPKLSCRWLQDLTCLNEEKIKEAERIYERARTQPQWAATAHKQPTSFAAAEPPARLTLELDLKKTRLTHLLKLKELLRNHPGPTPIQLSFSCGGRCEGLVQLRATTALSASSQAHLQEILPGLLKII